MLWNDWRNDMRMLEPGDLWEKMGSLDELELMQVLTNLFTAYESRLQQEPENAEAQRFFTTLSQALIRVSECNLNRR